MAENIYVADVSGTVHSPYGPVSLKQPNTRDVGKLYRQWGNEVGGVTARFYEMTTNEQATQETTWSATLLDNTRMGLRDEFIVEGVVRIIAQVPEWDSFARIALLASVWNMLGTPNSAQSLARDIYLYVKNTALPKLATVTTQAGLNAIDPTVADPFGDGTLWPT